MEQRGSKKGILLMQQRRERKIKTPGVKLFHLPGGRFQTLVKQDWHILGSSCFA